MTFKEDKVFFIVVVVAVQTSLLTIQILTVLGVNMTQDTWLYFSILLNPVSIVLSFLLWRWYFELKSKHYQKVIKDLEFKLDLHRFNIENTVPVKPQARLNLEDVSPVKPQARPIVASYVAKTEKDSLVDVAKKYNLTPAENRIVVALQSGMEDQKEIAKKLNRGVKTVEWHLSNVYRKVGVMGIPGTKKAPLLLKKLREEKNDVSLKTEINSN